MSEEPRIAIYPGSFDPFTNGHLDIARRAAKIFDAVIVAVGTNSAKKPLFDASIRASLVAECLKELDKETAKKFATGKFYDKLVVDYARYHYAQTIVRGIRADHDFGTEFQFVHANAKLDPEIEIMYLFAKADEIYLSSSVVREAFTIGKRIIPGSVPPPVEKFLRAMLEKK